MRICSNSCPCGWKRFGSYLEHPKSCGAEAGCESQPWAGVGMVPAPETRQELLAPRGSWEQLAVRRV